MMVTLCKGYIMFNIVAGKELMVHADECELQDGLLMKQPDQIDIKIEDLWVNDIMMIVIAFNYIYVILK